ncbi:MAG: hypothetical protein WC789_10465 [Lentisphaeria bacterium]
MNRCRLCPSPATVPAWHDTSAGLEPFELCADCRALVLDRLADEYQRRRAEADAGVTALAAGYGFEGVDIEAVNVAAGDNA